MSPEEKNKLLDYLKTAISVETDIETQNQVRAAAIKEKEARKPVLYQKTLPKIPDMPDDNSVDPISISAFFIACMSFLGCIICLFLDADVGPRITGFLICAIIGVICLIPIWSARKEAKKIEEYYYEKKERISSDYEKIKKENDNLKSEWHQQLAEWNNSNDALLAEMEQPYTETLHVRDQLYAIDAIYPKYQNLPALTSIYEYFITGRCDELTGPHGAYNMYEDEVRKDTVISQLNTVIENLEQIRQSQFMLYEQVKMIQKTTSAINGELAQIRGYTIALTQLTALNTYYAALNERNSRATMYYHLLP